MDSIEFPKHTKGGRPVKHPVTFRNHEDYVIGTVYSKDTPIEFFIDAEDLERVQKLHWYTVAGSKYIGTGVFVEGKKKTLYLHNFIMNRLEFPGKGTKESIDHVNRNGLDNRKSNLRLISQSRQNLNQAKPLVEKREKPELCKKLPPYMHYSKSMVKEREWICIQVKPLIIKWKSTSSKKVSLQGKLQQAMQKYREFCEMYPDIVFE